MELAGDITTSSSRCEAVTCRTGVVHSVCRWSRLRLTQLTAAKAGKSRLQILESHLKWLFSRLEPLPLFRNRIGLVPGKGMLFEGIVGEGAWGHKM